LTAFRLIVLLLVAGSLTGAVRTGGAGEVPQSPVGANHAPTPLSPAAMQADLRHLVETIEEVHPDPYRYTSRRAIRQMHEDAVTRLQDSASVRAFYVEAARLAAAFGDGHTRVDWPRRVFLHAMRRGDTVLPVQVERRTDAVHIRTGCADARTMEGHTLAVVGGRAAVRLHDNLQALVSGSPRYRAAQVDANFPFLVWSLGLSSPYRVVTRTHGTAAESARIDTVGGLRMPQVRSCLSDDSGAPVRFERVDAGSETIGVLTVQSLAPSRRSRTEIRRAFRTMETESIDGLVVDLRDNPGGATRMAVPILAPLTDAPILLTRRKSWKISDAYKAELRRRGADEDDGYLRARSGRVIDVDYDPKPLPKPPHRFDGPVAFVVGPRTFSSAVKLADAAQHYGLATIVGTETGGRPSSFGEGYRFDLPNSGLRAMASTAHFLRLNGKDDGRGVVPDLQVPPLHVGDTDVALQAAVQVVSGNGGRAEWERGGGEQR